MNDDFPLIKSIVVSRYAVLQANNYPPYTAGHMANSYPPCTAGAGCIMLWEMFSWACGAYSCGRTDQEGCGLLNIIADQLHPYMSSGFPTGNRIFQQDNALGHKARTGMVQGV
ncbi:hypothetical protein X975_01286, partial [Stegodyphus mimosarum]